MTTVKFDLQIDDDEFVKGIVALEMEAGVKICMMLEQVGWEVISFLRSLGHGMRPPVRVSESTRSAHPGGWADISGSLAGAYRFEVWASGYRVRFSVEAAGTPGTVPPVEVNGRIPKAPKAPYELRLYNGMAYAAALEAKDGYFVLTGVTEAGGQVETAIRRVITALGFDVHG